MLMFFGPSCEMRRAPAGAPGSCGFAWRRLRQVDLCRRPDNRAGDISDHHSWDRLSFLDPFFTTVVQPSAGHAANHSVSEEQASALAVAQAHNRCRRYSDRSANTLSKVSIFGILSLVGSLILLAIVLARSTYVTRAHVFVEQPLQFSHMHHVTDDGIDCRYCHTSVETSSFAGIPPTKTCMNCHSRAVRRAAIPRAGARQFPRQPTAPLDPRPRPA